MDLILPNYSLFIQIANFLVLLFVLNIILYRPIRKILYKRREEMATTKSVAEDLEKKSDIVSTELQE
ncbi:ATPase, partial [Thermodesulfobacteriota bacterium]